MSPEQINKAGFNYSLSLCSLTVTPYASTLLTNHQLISFLSQDQESCTMALPVLT
jgi:hypothetical protein